VNRTAFLTHTIEPMTGIGIETETLVLQAEKIVEAQEKISERTQVGTPER